MPRNVTMISVFLASPGDIDHEREVVASAIQNWNVVRGHEQALVFDLSRWETSVSAGFGGYGQDVVNSQIGDDYDILVVLFANRLGTPTPVAASGTVEEYQRALNRRAETGRPEIAVYFKDGEIRASAIDPDQLKALNEFRERVQNDGGFTKDFRSDDVLRFEIELLLDKCARSLLRGGSSLMESRRSIAISPSVALQETDDQDRGNDGYVDDKELGIIDVNENVAFHSTSAAQFLNSMTAMLAELSFDTQSAVSEVEEIRKTRAVEPGDWKPHLIRVAATMDKYSKFLEEETPAFSENSIALADDIRDVIYIAGDFETTVEEIESLEAAVQLSIDNMSEAQANQANMVNSILGAPRMISIFNKSRKRLVKNLGVLSNEMDGIRSIMLQALDEIKQFKKRM